MASQQWDMESTHSTTTGPDVPRRRIDRLRHWLTRVMPDAPGVTGYGRGLAAAYILLGAVNITGLAAAYILLGAVNITGLAAAQAGSNLCNTPITQTVNTVAPLVLAVVVAGGLMITYILHAYSGFKKDPQKAKEIKDWRNRAGMGAVSAPLVGKFLEIVIGIIGFGLASCIDIVPGF